MKFAKLLEDTKRFTDASWREHWINYKVRGALRLAVAANTTGQNLWCQVLISDPPAPPAPMIATPQGLKKLIAMVPPAAKEAATSAASAGAVITALCENANLDLTARLPQCPNLPVGWTLASWANRQRASRFPFSLAVSSTPHGARPVGRGRGGGGAF